MTVYVFFFFKQKTAYEMRISDWSSDVCSSDLFGDKTQFITAALAARYDSFALTALGAAAGVTAVSIPAALLGDRLQAAVPLRAIRIEIGRASCRERVCQYV